MKTNSFRRAVDEIKRNGGTRQTMYINEVWRSREMTIFGYSDGSAGVFEEAHPYMVLNSVTEAVSVLCRIQSDYDKALAADRRRYDGRGMKVESYTIEEWYRYAPRGTYFGD